MKKLRGDDFMGTNDACHVARVDIARGLDVPVHTHDFAELFWVEAGAGVHDVNGRREPLARGDLVLIRPKDVHRVGAAPDSRLTVFNVAYRTATLRHLRARYFSETPDFYGSGKMPRMLSLSGARNRMVAGAVDRLLRAPRSQLSLDRFLLTLFAELLEASAEPAEMGAPDWLLAACERIREPDQFVGGARAFARLAGRSPEHVAREARRRLGRTPCQIVNDARIAYAASKLATTSRTILDIALDCGFSGLAHFYKLFGEAYGQSPRRYRAQHHSVLR